MVAAASEERGQELPEEILSSGDLSQHRGYPQGALAARAKDSPSVRLALPRALNSFVFLYPPCQGFGSFCFSTFRGYHFDTCYRKK